MFAELTTSIFANISRTWHPNFQAMSREKDSPSFPFTLSYLFSLEQRAQDVTNMLSSEVQALLYIHLPRVVQTLPWRWESRGSLTIWPTLTLLRWSSRPALDDMESLPSMYEQTREQQFNVQTFRPQDQYPYDFLEENTSPFTFCSKKWAATIYNTR